MNPIVIEIVKSLGIPVGEYNSKGVFSGVEDEYELPEDISILAPSDIERLLAKHSEWACFLAGRLAEQESILLELEAELKNLEDTLLLDAVEDSLRAKKARARSNSNYLELEKRILITKSVVGLIKTAVDNENRRYAALSRQISVRGQDMDRVARNNNASYSKPPIIGKSRRTS